MKIKSVTFGRDWYGVDWRILRSNLVKLCVQKSGELFRELSGGSADLECITANYIETVLADIEKRVLSDRVGLWAHAMQLFLNRSLLVTNLQKELPKLRGESTDSNKSVSPKQALGQLMVQYFETARRGILAADFDVSPNRIKTWERLDRISRELARVKPVESRCTDEHFKQLANAVKTSYPRDKNLPRKVTTITAYFYQFSSECNKHVEYVDSNLQTTSLDESRELLAGVGMEILSGCLDQLSGDHLEVVNMEFRLGVGTVQHRTLKDFLHNHSIDSGEFKRLLKMAMEQLGICLETSLETAGPGYA